MHFADHSTEGCYAACLLDYYEHKLHGEVERLVARSFAAVLNIGCGKGCYAIGLARRMPTARVFGHDTDSHAQALCRQLGEANGVTECVAVGGLFRREDFSRFAEINTLLVMDTEGRGGGHRRRGRHSPRCERARVSVGPWATVNQMPRLTVALKQQ